MRKKKDSLTPIQTRRGFPGGRSVSSCLGRRNASSGGRDVVDLEIPLFGINMGTLGYLAEIDQYSIYPALDRLMSDRFTIEKE